MKKVIKMQIDGGLVNAIITALLGIIFLTWPDWAIKWICILLGAALAITGAFHIRDYVKHRKEGFALYFSLALGVVLLGLGVWLLTNPAGVIRLVQYIFGAFILFHGVNGLRRSVPLIKLGQGQDKWIGLVCAALLVVLGLVILVNPLGSVEALMMLIGVVLVFDGASDLWVEVKLAKVLPAIPGDVIETQGRELEP